LVEWLVTKLKLVEWLITKLKLVEFSVTKLKLCQWLITKLKLFEWLVTKLKSLSLLFAHHNKLHSLSPSARSYKTAALQLATSVIQPSVSGPLLSTFQNTYYVLRNEGGTPNAKWEDSNPGSLTAWRGSRSCLRSQGAQTTPHCSC